MILKSNTYCEFESYDCTLPKGTKLEVVGTDPDDGKIVYEVEVEGHEGTGLIKGKIEF